VGGEGGPGPGSVGPPQSAEVSPVSQPPESGMGRQSPDELQIVGGVDVGGLGGPLIVMHAPVAGSQIVLFGGGGSGPPQDSPVDVAVHHASFSAPESVGMSISVLLSCG
jgi:hypothetical protein